MEHDAVALQEVRERRLLIDRCDGWLFDEIEPFLGQRILEVGCGLGNLTRHLLERELVVGIDLSADSVTRVSARFSARPNVRAVTYDITDPSVLGLARFGFDTAISLNVLEHIEDDLLALRHMQQLLCPGGRLIAIVPAHGWLYGSMDRSIGHYRRYTREDLAHKMRAAGFHIEVQKYLNALGTLGWFVNGRVLKQQVPPKGQLRLFNLVVPFARAVECLVPLPFGLSLLSVARRPDHGADL
jgi:SAM-dependent methyltransferase